MQKLDNIVIKNYKSIKDLNLDLDSLNVLIGANGVGKSNFINIFKFLNKVLDKSLQNYTAASGGADSILHFGKKRSTLIELELSFDDKVKGYKVGLAPSVEDNFYFNNELIWFHKKNYSKPTIRNLGSGHIESKLPDFAGKKNTDIAKYVIHDLKSWKVYHFHDTSDSAKIKQTCDIEDNHDLHPNAGNLASFLYMLEKKNLDHFSNIVDAIRMAAPFFDRFNLKPSRLNDQKIRLEWKEKGSDSYFNASSLSDGTLRFMCLSTLLLQPNLPSMIILDEPELGLHPTAIMLLASLLRKASQTTQVLVATQSVTLVNQFVPENIIVLERQKGQSTFNRLDKKNMQDWLDEYGIGDLWEKNIIGGRP